MVHYLAPNVLLEYDTDTGAIHLHVSDAGKPVKLSGTEVCTLASKLRELIDYPID